MKRRDLLSCTPVLAGSALAGCLSLASGVSDTDIHLELTNLQPDPQPEQLRFEIEIANPYLTSENVPILNIKLENTETETVEVIRSSSIPPLPWPDVAVEPDAVGIAPEIQELRTVEEGTCPTVDGVMISLDAPGTHPVNPEAIHEDTRAIIPIEDNFDSDCPPAGTYRAEQRMKEHPDWGFEFELI